MNEAQLSMSDTPSKPDAHTPRRVAFAVPGDIDTRTGGYKYDRMVVDGLRENGWDVALVSLGTSFPSPTPEDMADAKRLMVSHAKDRPIIVDGLAFGALDPAILCTIPSPIIALIHHPLAYETGISEDQRARLLSNERTTLTQASHVLVPSPHTARVLTLDYGVTEDRLTVARPGTDRPKTAASKTDPPLILSVGIQVPRKGHDILLRALAELTNLAWQAVIVGGARDIPHAEGLARLVVDLELTDRVTLAGEVSEEDLAGLYRQAKIFALATRHEGYGIVFDEAMTHGLPIVTCDVGAVPETVPAEVGYLVPPDDPPAFARAVETLLRKTDLRAQMAGASAQAGEALPTWQDTVREIENVIEAIYADT